ESRLLRLRNIIVDLPPGPVQKRMLFSAHYDAYPGSPAANDNASGVAVLLGLCQELREGQVPMRAVFFDREEAWLRTPFLRLGLRGSLYHAFRHSLQDITAVYNLEFCGMGDYLVLWPIGNGDKDLPAVKEAREAAARLGIPSVEAHIPWYFLSSDHLSFRLKGLANALTLTLLPSARVSAIKELLSNTSVLKLLPGRRPWLPPPLSLIHTPYDTASRLSEESLKLMLAVLLEVCKERAKLPGQDGSTSSLK
ncbi:MAG: M28 family metallopeptidase, partial [Chloroflexota bacterium]